MDSDACFVKAGIGGDLLSHTDMGVEVFELDFEVDIAREIQERLKLQSSLKPLLIAIAGIPGAGKTTSAKALGKLLGPACLVVPMDGFHLSMDTLRARPDATDAIYRRGAPDTFDVAALHVALSAVCNKDGPAEVTFPGFDHAVGDPAPASYCFERGRHSILVMEGLYLLLEEEAWAGMSSHFDYRIFIEADVERAVQRLKVRNRCIPGYTPEEIDIRCDKVDRSNALLVEQTISRAGRVVQSRA